MKAGDILDALTKRWPDTEYLHVREAPSALVQGKQRNIDLLVVSLWASRGHELDAVEVKVSASDWKRELDNPAKADWWCRHAHRFWVAVPAELTPRVKSELPTGWGLLAVSRVDGKSKVVVKPEKRDPEPMHWSTIVGVMRAGAAAGFGALQRAEQRGYERGRQMGEQMGKAQTEPGRAERQLLELQEKVAAFESASGLDMSRTYGAHGGLDLGEAVRIVMNYRQRPQHIVEAARRQAAQMAEESKRVKALADQLEATLIPDGRLPLDMPEAS